MTPTPSHVATDELIETLERLEKEATPRPWVSEWDADDDVEGPYMVGGCIAAGGVELLEAADGCRAKDLDAVAEIRNHLPALISALKENKRMRTELERWMVASVERPSAGGIMEQVGLWCQGCDEEAPSLAAFKHKSTCALAALQPDAKP